MRLSAHSKLAGKERSFDINFLEIFFVCLILLVCLWEVTSVPLNQNSRIRSARLLMVLWASVFLLTEAFNQESRYKLLEISFPLPLSSDNPAAPLTLKLGST